MRFGGVVDHISGLRRTIYFARHKSGAVNHLHLGVEDFRILDADSFDIFQRPKGPARVVIWPRIADVVILSIEQHIGHSRIRLVHPNDITAGSEFTFLCLDILAQTLHLAALHL